MTKEEFLKLDCLHKEAYTRSRYVGGVFGGSVTYCRDCEEGFVTGPEKQDVKEENEKADHAATAPGNRFAIREIAPNR